MTRDFIEALVSDPVTIDIARRPEKDGGIPSKPGLYAWWLASDEALPDIDGYQHPSEPGLRLVYVGTAPKNEASKETLRSRVLKKHVGLGLAGSTFRRSLAALLWQERNWTPQLTEAGKWKFSPEDDAALRGWQEQNLRVTWLEIERPWESEPRAIDDLGPSFNLADNREHPFYEDMANARALFQAKAEAVARESG